MKRRILAVCLIVTIAIIGMGCGRQNESVLSDNSEPVAVDVESSGNTAEEQAQEDMERVKQETRSNEEAEEERQAVQEAQEAVEAAYANAGRVDLDEAVDSEALEFVEKMKIGWNLGNTFDAYTDWNKEDELSYETEWCGIVTTKEMIDAVKAAGFQTIRIPVSWHNHVSDDGSYTISEVWMNRVQEVVDYAVDNDMYIIINIHHDNSTNYMYPSQEYIEQSKAYVASVWSQVAERFADYDEHLIMEGLNEPRLVGTSTEWWLDMNRQECVEAVQYINELNQLFVDTVRASGGNNAERYLLVPGYAGSLQGATNMYFELPQDIAGNQNKILLEVHGYTPYGFALQPAGESGSTNEWSADRAASTSEIDSMMNTLYEKYVCNGTGVVIDEFGARDRGGNIQARTDFAAYYVAAARARGITCCWWDNGSFSGSGENFAIFSRYACQFQYPELVEGMMKACE